MVGLQEDTELSESPSFSFLNVGMSGSLSLIFLAKFQTVRVSFHSSLMENSQICIYPIHLVNGILLVHLRCV